MLCHGLFEGGLNISMYQISRAPLLIFCAALLAASGPSGGSWSNKPIQQWTEEDANQLLADSPWIKRTMPVELPARSEAAVRSSGRMGGGQGIGVEALTASTFTGFGSSPEGKRHRAKTHALEIRWESALPVRAAELKAQEDDPPDWQGSLYAIAIYDVPGLDNPSKTMIKGFAKTAFLKRDGKKDLKPLRVELLPQDDGLTTILYLFPRTEEITSEDKRIEFAAVLGRLSLAQYFYTEEMQFQGKLEL
jgi:hypothetical protein